MVTKDFVKTVIAGLQSWILRQLKKLTMTEQETFELCVDAGLIDPVTSKDGAIYTDKDGKILSL